MSEKIPKYTIKATIKTPIHIRSGEDYDRLDYFVDGESIKIVDQTWLEFLGQKDKKLFEDILNSIKQGKFVELEEQKAKFYKEYYKEYKEHSKEEAYSIDIYSNALSYIDLLDKKLSGDKNNQGIIKKHFSDRFTKKPVIPGSSLKGLFRTIFYFDKYGNDYEKHKKEYLKSMDVKHKKYEWYLKEIDDENKEYFSNIYFEDVVIQDYEKSIQKIVGVNKQGKTGKNKGMPLVVETVNKGYFDINITNFVDSNFNYDKFKNYIKDYSNIVITREEKIFTKIGIKTDFIDELYKLHDDGKYPVKIGMFKKSLTYKLYWEEILDGIYKELFSYLDKCKYEYKPFESNYELDIFGIKPDKLHKFARKVYENTKKINKQGKKYLKDQINITNQIGMWLGVGDKSIYLDENENPMGWIVLEFN